VLHVVWDKLLLGLYGIALGLGLLLKTDAFVESYLNDQERKRGTMFDWGPPPARVKVYRVVKGVGIGILAISTLVFGEAFFPGPEDAKVVTIGSAVEPPPAWFWIASAAWVVAILATAAHRIRTTAMRLPWLFAAGNLVFATAGVLGAYIHQGASALAAFVVAGLGVAMMQFGGAKRA
jgi:hypothetical protein